MLLIEPSFLSLSLLSIFSIRPEFLSSSENGLNWLLVQFPCGIQIIPYLAAELGSVCVTPPPSQISSLGDTNEDDDAILVSKVT